MVNRLARETPDINQTDSMGRSAIWLAARSNCGDCVSALATRNANVNQPDKQGVPPLVIAASQGSLDESARTAEGRGGYQSENACGQHRVTRCRRRWPKSRGRHLAERRGLT